MSSNHNLLAVPRAKSKTSFAFLALGDDWFLNAFSVCSCIGLYLCFYMCPLAQVCAWYFYSLLLFFFCTGVDVKCFSPVVIINVGNACFLQTMDALKLSIHLCCNLQFRFEFHGVTMLCLWFKVLLPLTQTENVPMSCGFELRMLIHTRTQ